MSVVRPQPGDKVLWVRFSAFGDVLRAAAAAYRFTKKFPGVHLSFLTRPEYGELLKNQPYIDDLLLWDVKKRPLDYFRVLRQIQIGGYKYLVSLHRGSAAALISLFSGIPIRLGYNRLTQFAYLTTHWEYLDALGVDFTSRDEPSIFTAEEDRQNARALLASLPSKKLFAVIGASKPQKLWPVRHWIEFLSPNAAEGWGIILSGHGEKEAQAAGEIESALQSGAVLNLVGQTPFPIMAAVAQSCNAAVGNDTGPLHLASLVGTPTLGFFGVTDAWEMNFRMPWFRDVRVNCPKAGCCDYHCPIDCLADITPERAISAFRELMHSNLATR
ncbi:glycosyl transferase [Synergistales bacterium]|nr:glycosyl transferase [Synergistales bacterium]